MARVVVLIVNWNGRRYLGDCLSSVLAQRRVDMQVVLVDNGSTDGSVPYVRHTFPDVRVMALDKNVGFAEGNNVGIRATDSEFVATLNADTCVEPNWLAALVAGMGAAERVGMCAAKMLFAHCPERINSTGIALDRAGIAWDRDGGRLDTEAGLIAGEVFGPCAGAALYRRELLTEIGGFDADFFYLYEDVDLAWRARWRGWRAWYCPAARVYHVHAGAGTEGTAFKRYMLGRNRIYALIKNYPFWPGLVRLPLLLAYDVMASVYSLAQSGDAMALKGRLAGYAQFGRMWNKRQPVQRHGIVSWRQVSSQMSSMRGPWAVMRRFSHLRSRTIGL